MEFEMSEYEWMENIDEWNEYFPCEPSMTSEEEQERDELDDFDPPEDNYANMDLDELLGYSICDDDPEPEIIPPPPALKIVQPTLLQNSHLFQPQSRYTFPVASLPSFPFLR